MDTRLVVTAILSLPLVAGLAIWLLKPRWAANAADKAHTGADTKRKALAEDESRFKRLLGALFVAPYAALGTWSRRFEDRYLRAGLRVTLACYLTGVLCMLLAVLLYAALMGAVLVAGIILMFWVFWICLKVMLGLEGSSEPRSAPSGGGFFNAVAQGGVSRHRDGLLGEYVEHTDRDGRVVGRSRVREGLMGEYVEHTDVEGKRVGTSRERDGLLGEYQEHRDSEGAVVGRSKHRDGILGPYTEHTNREGRAVGESRDHDGLFGEETRHKPRT